MERWGIQVFHRSLDADTCFSLAPIRNELFTRAKHPWVLKIDADERLNGDALKILFAAPDQADIAGYFMRWPTRYPDEIIEDYKMCLARREIKNQGLVHDNLQVDIRTRGLNATWYGDLILDHRPTSTRLASKADYYLRRLECALSKAPAWYRYHWFLGYQYFCRGQLDNAENYLRIGCRALSRKFPVECLNSHMVLADILARREDMNATKSILSAALIFYEVIREDFEVKINFRLKGWFDQALQNASEGNLAAVRAYNFAR
jgi:glycosyltransferase involved in cell wall biosynthesis